jgi:outer membrane receptor protein involved in Fe transport
MFKAVVTLALALALSPWAAAQTAQVPQAKPVDIYVIGNAPLPGIDRTREEIPTPVQTATSDDISKIGALDLSNFLLRRLDGVHVNEIQGNPFQADLNFRGYTASPLLGTAQGMSVYMDGVRLNQPFGDVVSWDLIPRIAISSTTLMPGSNPLFGLNTLGGALSVQTKDGRHDRGGTLQATLGSHARRALELEYGGTTGNTNRGAFNWYFAGNRFGERGWRSDSHSDVRQGFGKFGWEKGASKVELSLAYAKNSLMGSALQEERLLARDYSEIYTRPDITKNRSTFINLTGSRALGSTAFISGNIYYRNIKAATLNADINEESLDQSVYQPGAAERNALAAAGYSGFPSSGATAANTPFPFWRCLGNVLINDEPGEKCNGLVNRTDSLQHNYGSSAQVSLFKAVAGRMNQVTVGGGYDRSSVGFDQSSELGYLNPDRSVSGTGAFADGITGGFIDGEPLDTRVSLGGIIHTYSVYATDTFPIAQRLSVTASARFNRTAIHNEDRITPGGGPGSLDGDHVYSRVNPALGVTYSPTRHVNLYVNYGEGSRAPTSIELGCADPDQPCKLPNAMSGDPPLKQVTTRTWELGARSGPESVWTWNAGAFHMENRNDILFAASTQTGFGYFKNFGATRRQGIDLGFAGKRGRVNAGVSYTFLQATYRSSETVNGSGNSSNETAEAGEKGFEGTIEIQAGDRIPLIPRHLAKLFVEAQVTKRLSLDLDVMAVSSSFARGNENNLHAPDGVVYLGPGTSPGYGVANVGFRFDITSRIQLTGQANNVLNHRYYTAAQLGPTGITPDGNFIARPLPAVNGEFPLLYSTFFAPGAPTLVSFGTKIKF